jgi:hypothetical protein
MTDQIGQDVCDDCGRGHLIKRMQEINFLQWTDKGYLSCHATVPMTVCDTCDAKTWDDAAEAIIEKAVQREYDKLP